LLNVVAGERDAVLQDFGVEILFALFQPAKLAFQPLAGGIGRFLGERPGRGRRRYTSRRFLATVSRASFRSGAFDGSLSGTFSMCAKNCSQVSNVAKGDGSSIIPP
jgi:hypothetical protein